jgi:hypothetical protein
VLRYFGCDLGVGSRLLRSYVEGDSASNAKPGYIIGEGEERGKDMDRYSGSDMSRRSAAEKRSTAGQVIVILSCFAGSVARRWLIVTYPGKSVMLIRLVLW